MNAHDIRLEGEERIDDTAVLQRVLNAVGTPYSLIIENGIEVMNCERDREKDMIRVYKDRKKVTR